MPPGVERAPRDRARDMTRRQSYGVHILSGMLSRVPPPKPDEMASWAKTAWKWADVLIEVENSP